MGGGGVEGRGGGMCGGVGGGGWRLNIGFSPDAVLCPCELPAALWDVVDCR